MSSHDSLLFWRTLAASLVILGLVTGVVLVTDEAYSTASMRVARLCALSPLIAAAAMASSLALARGRGELRALACLGASPWVAAWGALCAAWLFGVVAALLLITPLADVNALFPQPPLSSGWLVAGRDFIEPARGILVKGDGSIDFVKKLGLPRPYATPGGIEAFSTVLPQVLVLPAWLVAPLRTWARVWGLGLTLTLTLLALHAAALGRISQALLPLVAAPLVAQLAFAFERSRSQLALFSAMLGRTPRTRN